MRKTTRPISKTDRSFCFMVCLKDGIEYDCICKENEVLYFECDIFLIMWICYGYVVLLSIFYLTLVLVIDRKYIFLNDVIIERCIKTTQQPQPPKQSIQLLTVATLQHFFALCKDHFVFILFLFLFHGWIRLFKL